MDNLLENITSDWVIENTFPVTKQEASLVNYCKDHVVKHIRNEKRPESFVLNNKYQEVCIDEIYIRPCINKNQ